MLTKDEAIRLRDNLVYRIFQKNGWTGDMILSVISDFVEREYLQIVKLDPSYVSQEDMARKINDIIETVNLMVINGDNNNE